MDNFGEIIVRLNSLNLFKRSKEKLDNFCEISSLEHYFGRNKENKKVVQLF